MNPIEKAISTQLPSGTCVFQFFSTYAGPQDNTRCPPRAISFGRRSETVIRIAHASNPLRFFLPEDTLPFFW